MVADAVAWLCRSPRRLLVAVGGLVLVIVIGAAAFNGGGSGGTAGAAEDGGPPPAPSVSAAAVPDAQPFVDAAVRFVNVWAQAEPGETPEAWQARLEPLAMPELSDALASTDLAELPGSPPEGSPTVRYVATDSALVVVPLANGSTVVVTVVSTGRSGWRASDVQPDVGDFGDTP